MEEKSQNYSVIYLFLQFCNPVFTFFSPKQKEVLNSGVCHNIIDEISGYILFHAQIFPIAY